MVREHDWNVPYPKFCEVVPNWSRTSGAPTRCTSEVVWRLFTWQLWHPMTWAVPNNLKTYWSQFFANSNRSAGLRTAQMPRSPELVPPLPTSLACETDSFPASPISCKKRGGYETRMSMGMEWTKQRTADPVPFTYFVCTASIVIGGGGGGGGGAVPPSLSNVIKKPQNYPQKHSLEVKVQFSWWNMPPDPLDGWWFSSLKPEPPHFCRAFSALVPFTTVSFSFQYHVATRATYHPPKVLLLMAKLITLM